MKNSVVIRLLAISASLLGLLFTGSAFAADEDVDRKAKWQEMKAQFDVDGDGQLNDAERQAFREDRQQKRFAEVDTNGDGQISFEEQSAAREKRREKMIARFDVNGDGELDETERQAAKEARKKMRHCREGAKESMANQAISI